ncbi:hypothetical protein Q4Q34_15645 [Flavivirga abyssicola]|uniref:hypothetical protein n=1 Tax=Flavivirga abyssicola TaxID=3063533 RepID=UPI0026DEBC46|nr:hypothetical protein [Flavivirga sp. MEBiC07777]WVK12651.1 hypothetical protein Q4Q34_15645 [Flavivirga sp. MEBiC07777]
MKNCFLLISISFLFLFTESCNEDTFIDDPTLESLGAPKNLSYTEILNAREFSLLKTDVPTIDTDGLTPTFEIVSGRTEDGTILDDTFMSQVSIAGAVETIENLSPENYYELNGQTVTTYVAVNSKNNGVVTIADENNFGIGNYYFTIRATTTAGNKTLSTTFEDALHISVGPELVTNLLYSPLAQNLVVGAGSTTTQPFLITGNPDVMFELGSDDDKLNIDSQTGIISLEAGYATVENDTIYPKVIVTSNISGEKTEFQGESFLFLVASNTPVTLPKQTNYFFYPTLEANNKLFGYSVEVITPGSVAPANIWKQTGPSPLAGLDTSLPVIDGKQAIFTNAVVGGASTPHESDVIINTQDLSQYRLGFNLSAVFYTQNRFVEYLSDGRTPTDLEIYISTDYTGDNAAATWTKVNDQVACQINSNTATPFIGTPYPGDQNKADPDGLKDPTRNADGRWVRCELDLNPYKDEKRFTLKFKYASYFTGEIRGATGRAGRYLISDVHFKATEQ